MATEIWVNIGLGYGLLPGSTKPSMKPIEFHRNCSEYHSQQSIWKLHIWKFFYISPGANEVSFYVSQTKDIDINKHLTQNTGNKQWSPR